MKRWIALAVGALAMLCAARPAAAVTRAAANSSQPPPRTSPAVPPNDALGVAFAEHQAGPGLAVTLDPGASEQHDLVISNRTRDLRLSVKLLATDASGALTTGTAAWIAFGADVVQIDPNSSQTIPVTVTVPHDTQPGEQLAHVTATIDSAALATDGSPRALSLNKTLPVAITVNGTPTAQVSITNVTRIDKGSKHQLGIVMRNFGDQGAHVSGTIVVSGSNPQTHPFSADLAPRRDTTLLIPWNAPSKNVGADVDVQADYGGGNTASWSSQVGGTPVPMATLPGGGSPTPATATTDTTPGDATSGSSTPSASASDPWWKKGAIPGAIVLAIILAAVWFFFEMRSSKRRRDEMPSQMPFIVMPGMMPQQYGPPAPMTSDATVELAKQLVALSEVIVRLATGESEAPPVVVPVPPDRARARSPEADPPPASAAPGAHVSEPVASRVSAPEDEELRPPPEPEPDARDALMQRLLALDRERRRLHHWMDASEEAGA
jgi:hypothetical protein